MESTARTRLSELRDLLIIVGILSYFVGFLYLYAYFRSFDVSIWTVASMPQNVLLFSYKVFSWNIWITSGALFVACVFVFVLTETLQWLQRRETAALETQADRTAQKYRFGALVLHVLGAILVLIILTAIGPWARGAADADVRSEYARVHLGSPEHIRAILTPEFAGPHSAVSAAVASINAAGRMGRVAIIAAQEGSITFLVGGIPGPKDDPATRIPSDRIFNIDKAGLSIEVSSQ